MFEYILAAICLIFSLLGLSEFLHGVRIKFFSGGKRAETYSVILLNEDCPVQKLKYAGEQFLWHGKNYADYIIAVDSGMDAETAEICRVIAEKYNIKFCTLEAFKEYFH